MTRYWLLALSLALTPALHAADRDVEALARKIDKQLESAWSKDTKPAARSDDAEFFRRVHLDLAGRIPSVTEVRDFLDDDRPDKRRLWVERILLGDPDDLAYRDAYVGHLANVWRTWLLAQTDLQAQFQQPALDAWLRERLRTNAGYDQIVRELLTEPAGGGRGAGSAAVYFQANENKPENLAGSTARLFLGVKLECAQCHDHPFDKWTRTQFWQFAGFFTDLTPQGQPRMPGRARGEIKIGGQDRVVQARFLDGKEPKWKDGLGTRPTLVEWMTATDNPYFAQAFVNRLWSHFFGNSLIAHPDGSDSELPAAHKDLLTEMSRQFVAHQYDMKFLIRAIMASEAYQRSSTVSHASQKDVKLFARMPLRGLSPEQLFDSLAVATEYHAEVGNTQARNQFLSRFVAQDQKTESQTSILQALYLMNSQFIADRTNLEKNRTLATLAEQRTTTARKIESLYLVVLSRKPRIEEAERFIKYVEKGGPTKDSNKALADVFWVLLNSPEFILNH
jgi:hypothetical protein